MCALFSKQHPSAHRFYRSYGYSSLIVYSRSMELRIETFGKLFSASEGFMYDDRPLFLSFFYSDTLFGLVMQIVKELKFYLPRRIFCFRLRDHRKDPVNFASFISDIDCRADCYSWLYATDFPKSDTTSRSTISSKRNLRTPLPKQ